jgi:hypothetical protein
LNLPRPEDYWLALAVSSRQSWFGVLRLGLKERKNYGNVNARFLLLARIGHPTEEPFAHHDRITPDLAKDLAD